MSQNDQYAEYDPEWAATQPHVPKGYYVESIPDFRQKVQTLRATIDAQRPLGPTEGLKVIETYITVEAGEKIRVKAFVPDARDDEVDGFPLFQWIHGGGWIQGNVVEEEPIVRDLVVNSRVTCVCGDQRVAPEYPYPAAILDSEAILKWAIHHAAELSVNVSKGVVVGGMSSGSNVASVMAHRSLQDPELKGVLSGQLLVMPCLISPHAYSSPKAAKFKPELLSFEKDPDGYLLTQDQLLKFTEAYHGEHNADNPEVSPLLSESFEGLPPMYIQISGRDMLRDEQILYERLLTEAGVPTKVDIYPGVPHGFHLVFGSFTATKKQQKDFAAGLDWLLGRAK